MALQPEPPVIHLTPAKPSLWLTFSAAPHRMLFLTGTIQVVLVVAWWLLELTARVAGTTPPAPQLPAVWAHGYLMIYGVFPYFIFGFLFTVYPRWMGGAAIARHAYVPVFMLLTAGTLLFYAGLHAGRALLVLALALTLAGWTGALATLYRVYFRARQRGAHEHLLNLALAAGGAGVAFFLAALLNNDFFWFRLSRETGLWLFLVPVVFLVAHRMIPFFSQSALMNYVMVRPAWGPPLMLVCVLAHTGFELTGLAAWRWLADAPLAVAALHLTWTWQFRKSFHARLVAMLHIAFLWLGIAMLLYSAQSLALLVTGADPFGRAPLHALGLGFFTGMIVAMASRVILGHSGRAVAADQLTWVALLGVNLTALARLAAEFLPAWQAALNLTAALAWLAFLLPWVLRYAPLLLHARADNQPG
jgi:uncharacterized protein involved in response to NO